MSISAVYAAVALVAMAITVGYAIAARRINTWLFMLFICVTVVNAGYFMLSVSGTLTAALWSNRVSYLGSVFLPFTMLMSILNICKIRYPKWLIPALLGIDFVIFGIAASPGILDIYYKEVSLGTASGITVLNKVYGPLHSIYLYYLVIYFSSMVAVILVARSKRDRISIGHAILLLCATLVNIAVWLLEQLVHIDFEFLAVSYIISELFLLVIDTLMDILKDRPGEAPAAPGQATTALDGQAFTAEQYEHFVSQLPQLTPTERTVYEMYAEGKSSKDILVEMNISENTLKYHNRNIYSKLGISTRKQLKALAAAERNRSV